MANYTNDGHIDASYQDSLEFLAEQNPADNVEIGYTVFVDDSGFEHLTVTGYRDRIRYFLGRALANSLEGDPDGFDLLSAEMCIDVMDFQELNPDPSSDRVTVYWPELMYAHPATDLDIDDDDLDD